MVKKKKSLVPNNSFTEFLLYTTADGKVKVEIFLRDENIWLTQVKIAVLFGVERSVVTKHLQNIYQEGELDKVSTCAKIAQVQAEGARHVTRSVEFYSLDAILSVGYRVNSRQATLFRIWATERLKEYIIKGFTMDDERLKKLGGGNYFEELLARIRDIRSSEKAFWRKALDIYATSIDYNPSSEASEQFFATVQNKMHWAAHGRTAAEIIAERVDASKANMGLSNWKGGTVRKEDVRVAKNYLSHDELDTLNRIVSMYLDFAELQAKNRRPMHMKDWISKLDDFLRISERDILTHAGKISHEDALLKAEGEFTKYRALENAKQPPVEKHFQEAIAKTKALEHSRHPKDPAPGSKSQRRGKKVG